MLHSVPFYVAVALRGWEQHGTKHLSGLGNTPWGLGELLGDKVVVIIIVVIIILIMKWL